MGTPRIIKKYPNRRLYDTETSTYITLAEVKDLVLQYKEFQVQDAKSGDDLTRAILLQIILEEESTGGLPMFSSDLLSQLIRFYGNAMQGVMGAYLLLYPRVRVRMLFIFIIFSNFTGLLPGIGSIWIEKLFVAPEGDTARTWCLPGASLMLTCGVSPSFLPSM